MELILLRHGEPETAESRDRPVDPALTDRGRWQAERVADWLACEAIDHVVTSSKRRAKQTAAPLVERLGLEPEVIADFDEVDRGARIYAPVQELQQRFPEYWKAIVSGDWESIGWDSPEAFHSRVTRAFDELLARRPGRRVVVACHAGTMLGIASHVLGLSDQRLLSVPPHAGFTRLALRERGECAVLSLNEAAHFDARRERVVGPTGDGFEAGGR